MVLLERSRMGLRVQPLRPLRQEVLSPKTVRNYISEIYSKLQVTDRI